MTPLTVQLDRFLAELGSRSFSSIDLPSGERFTLERETSTLYVLSQFRLLGTQWVHRFSVGLWRGPDALFYPTYTSSKYGFTRVLWFDPHQQPLQVEVELQRNIAVEMDRWLFKADT